MSQPSSKRRARRPRRSASDRGRLIFALDATMSRQATWDLAQELQARMFQAAAGLGGLDVQLVYFRGSTNAARRISYRAAQGLGALMASIGVRGGDDPDRQVFAHARNESRRAKIGALVFVGDAMEENIDVCPAKGGRTGIAGRQGVHVSGRRGSASRRAFREIARLTGGAYEKFNAGAASRLESLLRAAAAYAAGGRAGLEAQALKSDAAGLLLQQMR